MKDHQAYMRAVLQVRVVDEVYEEFYSELGRDLRRMTREMQLPHIYENRSSSRYHELYRGIKVLVALLRLKSPTEFLAELDEDSSKTISQQINEIADPTTREECRGYAESVVRDQRNRILLLADERETARLNGVLLASPLLPGDSAGDVDGVGL